MIALENIIEEKDRQIAELFRRILKFVGKIDILEKALTEFEKKLEQYEKNMITFANHMKGVCDHLDDLAVEFNDTMGNITVESEDNLMEKNF